MRILFEGFWWYQGPGANRSVQRDLITTWLEQYPDDEVIVAVREPVAGVAPPLTATVTAKMWPQAISNIIELPRLAKKSGADVTVSHNYTPLTGPAVTFIHDVMFVEHPEWFSVKERAYFWPMLASASRAASVCTSTQTEADRIARSSGSVDHATAIGLAVPRDLELAEPVEPVGAPAPGTYAICVGRLNVRKNLAAVIRGAIASKAIAPDRPLLIIGSSEYSGVSMSIPAEFAPSVDSGAVRFLGRISDGELAWFYHNAALAVCLSLDEGFGLPPIEAARFSTPLLVSDIPVFRETVGGYASFIDPNAKPDDVGTAIAAAWSVPVDEKAAARINERYAWPEIVSRLRYTVRDAVRS